MINPAEVDTLMNVLKSQLREAATGLYAEKEWARSIEVEMKIVDEWREGRKSFNASDLDGPVWSVQQMNGRPRNYTEHSPKKIAVVESV